MLLVFNKDSQKLHNPTSEGFFQGGIVNFYKVWTFFQMGASSDEISFYRLKTKKAGFPSDTHVHNTENIIAQWNLHMLWNWIIPVGTSLLDIWVEYLFVVLHTFVRCVCAQRLIYLWFMITDCFASVIHFNFYFWPARGLVVSASTSVLVSLEFDSSLVLTRPL